MTIFHIAAILLGLAAVIGYINHRYFKLPHTIGLMVITLVLSLLVLVADLLAPQAGLKEAVKEYIGQVDFNKTLMDGMLCFLLFAGALHINLSDLLERRFAIGTLATVGVLISTLLVGFMTWQVFRLLGIPVALGPCLVFGALISPTDPVSVLGLLKTANAPRSLEAKIAGESLFNDGVGVVVFIVLVSVFLGGAHGGEGPEGPWGVAGLFLQEVAGGAVLGLVLGTLAYRAMKTIDQYQLEVIITLALVMVTYSVASALHFSGPIAVVLAGLFIGNHGKKFAMSEVTVDHMEKFWSLIDEILNSILFLLIALEVFIIPLEKTRLLEAGLLAIPVVLLARFASVSIPISILKVRRQFSPGVIPILTWSGLRGGISVALVLSLKDRNLGETFDLLVLATYSVVLFSVIVQGLTVKRLVRRYRDR
jgi:CPA1 family monovalent cation:H+ antiporter